MPGAAQRTNTAGLILIAGAGEPAGKIIERQLAAAKVPMSLQDASRRIVIALEAGQTVTDVPPELAPLFRPSVQPYLSSWLPLDPAAELARVQAPVLIVQGTTDLQVTVADARRLAGARPEAPERVIAPWSRATFPEQPGSHVLRHRTPVSGLPDHAPRFGGDRPGIKIGHVVEGA